MSVSVFIMALNGALFSTEQNFYMLNVILSLLECEVTVLASHDVGDHLLLSSCCHLQTIPFFSIYPCTLFFTFIMLSELSVPIEASPGILV